jgi:hypothetical protein
MKEGRVTFIIKGNVNTLVETLLPSNEFGDIAMPAEILNQITPISMCGWAIRLLLWPVAARPNHRARSALFKELGRRHRLPVGYLTLLQA